MRIALTIHALFGGGAERLMSQLANRWAADHEVHLVTWSRPDTDAYLVEPGVVRHGLDLLYPSWNPWQGWWANRKRVLFLRGKLREIDPDFILSFADQMNIVALQAARPLARPVWISEHSDPRLQRLGPLWETWRKLVYPKCSGCVVLTVDIAGYMVRLVHKSKLRVIPPAIFPASDANQRSCEHRGSQTRTVLFVGRFSREKRLDTLIEAWRGIQNRLPEWRLRLVGDGPQRQDLQNRAAGVPSIEFTGWSRNPAEHYQAADLFVLCSEYEGFPVALLEAMKYGLPCIATDCCAALTELNNPRRCVRIIPVGAARKMGETIVELAFDSQERTVLGERGRSVSARYHWSQIGPRWDALLSEPRSIAD